VNVYEQLEEKIQEMIKASNKENEQLINENNNRIEILNEKMEKMFESGLFGRFEKKK